jgi:hypothetical protein
MFPVSGTRENHLRIYQVPTLDVVTSVFAVGQIHFTEIDIWKKSLSSWKIYFTTTDFAFHRRKGSSKISDQEDLLLGRLLVFEEDNSLHI